MNRVFDSSGPEGKVRGTPQQIIEKYQFLARDAQLGNDRVAAENFQQHAEHYTRMLAQAQREQAAEQEARRQQQEDQRARNDDRGRQNNGQNNGQQGQNNGQSGQNGQNGNGGQNHQQRQAEQSQPPRDDSGNASDAFDVAPSSDDDSKALVVETPEGNRPPQETPSEATEQKPRNTRKPRAPKAEAKADGDAPKPRRAPRKPRAPKGEGDSPPAPEMKSSAAE
ncbi:hypothetical protein ROE7235_02259 [Roseibaca ekhonensis]|uniref:DUF4167 domain-containing protein n=1 Tax=Roseinatronobacter ekhonensis TaxID=254356 RepID=A0A3B0MSA6_9RHOB|nr:hypothetical protein ROE7235_02259 [Roseibaca ekhonensis]